LDCLLSISPAAQSRERHGTYVPHRHLANQAFACPLHIPRCLLKNNA
jgi:hypothetical protein